MKILYLITARGGSKGVPGKNIKELCGKPLIYYSLDVARKLAKDIDICVTTDSLDTKKKVEDYGLKVPFVRPKYLATDTAGSYEVIVHAVKYYQRKGTNYDCVVLLQPTSPFRTKEHVQKALKMFTENYDMVVSMRKARTNPYYQMYAENSKGYLRKVIKTHFTRRQDCPEVWEQNGAIYIIKVKSLLSNNSFSRFKKVKKYVMEEIPSTEIDTLTDWKYCEFLLKEKLVTI